MEERLRKWILDSVVELLNSDITQSAHIDEFMVGELENADVILDKSVRFWNIFCRIISTVELMDIQVFFKIALEDNEGELMKAPTDLGVLKTSLDLYEVPIVYLYKPTNSSSIPMVEFYRTPILFSLPEINSKTIVFYKEHRRFEDIKSGSYYTRELNFVLK